MEGCKDGQRCTKRLWVFLFACLPVRIAFLVLALLIERPGSIGWVHARTVLAAVCLLIGLGLISTFARKGNGGEGFAGGERYWDSLSHGLLYVGFAVSFFLKAKGAWIFLVGDLILALVTVGKYYSS